MTCWCSARATGATPFAALFEHGEDPPEVTIEPDGTAALVYSSGTTGLPKGVELSHRALIANVMQTDTVLRLDSSDVMLAVAPFFHVLGFVILMNLPLASGATVVSMPRFELEGFLSAIQDHRVTGTIVVPPIALGLARHPAVERYDLSSLRFVGCGAAPLGRESQRACADRLGCLVEQGYGMTETTAGIAISSMVEPAPQRAGPGGHPVARHRGAGDRSGVRAGSRRRGNRRDHRPRPSAHDRLPGAPRRDGGNDRQRRLAAHRRHRDGSTSRAASTSPTASRS